MPAFCKEHSEMKKEVAELRGTIYGEGGNPGIKEDIVVLKTKFSDVGKYIMLSSALLGILMIVLKFAFNAPVH